MEFRSETLSNGLEVVAECNPAARSLAMGYFVKTGSRDESDEISGVSHFLEHMAFKGTARRSADDVNREFDELGAYYNAFTSEEKTVYYAAVLPEHQTHVLDILSDIMRPALREEDFNTEKQVIIEEIRMYQDQPPFGADERCKALHYGRHPLGRSVLGTIESITDLPVDAMRSYFKSRYSPGNIALVAAGRVDFERLVREAEARCGQWEKQPAPRTIDNADSAGAFECMHKESATQEYTIQLANGPSATDPDRFAAKVLSAVLGDDSGSRLYWALVDPGIAEHASLGHYDYHGAGLFLTYASSAPEHAETILQTVREIYTRAQDEGFTIDELDQAKSKINSRVVLSSERPRGRLYNVGANWTYRREYRAVRDDLNAVAAVTTDQLSAVLAKHPLTRSTTVVVGPIANMSEPA